MTMSSLSKHFPFRKRQQRKETDKLTLALKSRRISESQYQYKPLHTGSNVIRVATLLPGAFDEDILICLRHATLIPSEQPQSTRLTLEEVKLSLPKDWHIYQTLEGRYMFASPDWRKVSFSHPRRTYDRRKYELPALPQNQGSSAPFEALSYAWGDEHRSEAVFIHDEWEKGASEGKDGYNRLQVGKNLAEALRHLRHLDVSRDVWIDAICIDQSNPAERGEQIKRMASIFSLAQRVIVWLGPERDNSKTALTALSYMGDQVERLSDRQSYQAPNAKKLAWWGTAAPLPYDDAEWEAIASLLERRWFNRLWVFQESQLAVGSSQAYCGHDKIPWYTLRKAVLMLNAKDYIPNARLRDVLVDVASMMENVTLGTWLSVLRDTQDKDCTDPRDRIYGVLAMSPASLTTDIKPSYSLAVSEVFKQATITYIKHSRRIDLLEHTNSASRDMEGPSWVPDWDGSLGSEIAYTSFASGFSCSSAVLVSDDDLEVIGVHNSTVREASNPASRFNSNIESCIREWKPEDLLTTRYPTGESLMTAFALTIICGVVTDRCLGMNGPSSKEWEAIFLSFLTTHAKIGVPRHHEVTHALGRLNYRTFIHTTDGYIGISAEATKPGE